MLSVQEFSFVAVQELRLLLLLLLLLSECVVFGDSCVFCSELIEIATLFCLSLEVTSMFKISSVG